MLYFTMLEVLIMSTVKSDPAIHSFYPVQKQMNIWVIGPLLFFVFT